MPCLLGNYKQGGYFGPIIEVAILQSPTSVTLSQTDRKTHTHSKALAIAYRALIDTGATDTCISPKVVEQLRLEPTGRGEMTSASGKSSRKKYLFTLGIPFARQVDPVTKQVREAVGPSLSVEGWEFHMEEPSKFDVLLGMNVISLGSLKLDRDGHFSFCL